MSRDVFVGPRSHATARRLIEAAKAANVDPKQIRTTTNGVPGYLVPEKVAERADADLKKARDDRKAEAAARKKAAADKKAAAEEKAEADKAAEAKKAEEKKVEAPAKTKSGRKPADAPSAKED